MLEVVDSIPPGRVLSLRRRRRAARLPGRPGRRHGRCAYRRRPPLVARGAGRRPSAAGHEAAGPRALRAPRARRSYARRQVRATASTTLWHGGCPSGNPPNTSHRTRQRTRSSSEASLCLLPPPSLAMTRPRSPDATLANAINPPIAECDLRHAARRRPERTSPVALPDFVQGDATDDPHQDRHGRRHHQILGYTIPAPLAAPIGDRACASATHACRSTTPGGSRTIPSTPAITSLGRVAHLRRGPRPSTPGPRKPRLRGDQTSDSRHAACSVREAARARDEVRRACRPRRSGRAPSRAPGRRSRPSRAGAR